MTLYTLKHLLINIKYSFLKAFGWRDIWHDDPFFSSIKYSVYVDGKKFHGVAIKEIEMASIMPINWYPYYLEFEDGSTINIYGQDQILYLPWHLSKEGKKRS